MRVVLLCLLGMLAVSQGCPTNWIPFFSDSSRCFRPFKEPLMYTKAEQYCRAMSSTGHLISICNAFDNQQVHSEAQQVDTECKYWIGMNRILDSSTWSWIDGQTCSYKSWMSGYPQSTGSDCAYMDASLKEPQWQNDLDCAWAYCFICEY